MAFRRVNDLGVSCLYNHGGVDITARKVECGSESQTFIAAKGFIWCNRVLALIKRHIALADICQDAIDLGHE